MRRVYLGAIAAVALLTSGAQAQTTQFAKPLPAPDMAPAPVLPPLPPAVVPPPTPSENRALATGGAAKDAADAAAHDKQSPIPQGALEVTASGTLEWLRGDQMYVARQNAVARHNDVTIKADTLVAHYQAPAPGTNGGKSSGTEVTLVTAEGNPVEVIAPTAVAYGQHGTYDVTKHQIQLLGDNLKLVTTDEVITARDSLNYYEDADTGVARGDAVLVRGDDRLTADMIAAKFVNDKKKNGAPAAPPQLDADGNPVKPHALDHLDARGNVKLVTQTDIVTGDEGTYSPITDITIITGHVHITREDNQLDGARAEVDMATGISRIFAAPHEKVHALLNPKKKDAASADNGKLPSSGRL